ncbi:MAG: lipid-A-disaccharide synthase [Bdellovibrio sp.]|nr:lipid-A-disaccharide synthase [Bdellovibrio sp.]
MKTEIMIIAAEASSAHYALKLMQHWKAEGKDYHYFGVGSDEMEQNGFERFGKSEEMAVVGAAEIIAHYSKLKAIFNELVKQAELRKPKVVVVMDYPEFNLMLSKKLFKFGLKVFYYISPQVWAWRKNRVETIKKYCVKAFLLFPFEVDFYKSRGIPYEFVGHPLLDELDPDLYDQQKITARREHYGIKSNEKILALMPGSRTGELDQLLNIQLEVARRLLKKYPHLRLMVFIAPSVKKEAMQARLEDFKSPYILLKDDPNKMISLADYLLVASGTATLMVGLLHKPMVIMYKMKWTTGIFVKLLVRGIKFFGLVNLILGREVVPERKQADANPDELFKLMDRYITDPDYYAQTVEELKKISSYLGNPGATARVAKTLEAYL